MKKEDLKPGDLICIPYAYEWKEVRVIQVQDGKVLWQSLAGYIIDVLDNREFFFIKRPKSFKQWIKELLT